MTNWKPCSERPESPGLYLVQRCFMTGEPLEEQEMMRFDGADWTNRMGLPVMHYDKWRDVK